MPCLLTLISALLKSIRIFQILSTFGQLGLFLVFFIMQIPLLFRWQWRRKSPGFVICLEEMMHMSCRLNFWSMFQKSILTRTMSNMPYLPLLMALRTCQYSISIVFCFWRTLIYVLYVILTAMYLPFSFRVYIIYTPKLLMLLILHINSDGKWVDWILILNYVKYGLFYLQIIYVLFLFS